MSAPPGTRGEILIDATKGSGVIVEDWKMMSQEWVNGTLRRMYVNSQGCVKATGHTPESVTDKIVTLCREMRDGTVKREEKEFRQTMIIPPHVMDQMMVENGRQVFNNPDAVNDLLINNPDLKQFRTKDYGRL